MNDLVYYLSGPISGNPKYLADFRDAEEKLRRNGIKNIINPANLGSVLHEEAGYEDYMDLCMQLLDKAHAIVQLPGWEQSLGCQREYGYSLALEKATYPLSLMLEVRKK